MRQNLNDIQPVFLQKGKQTSLKYGLTIKIDINSLNLESIKTSKKSTKTTVKELQGIKIRPFSKNDLKKYFIVQSENKFDKFHKKNVNEGLIIEIPDKKRFDIPLQINTNVLSENNAFQIIILLGKSSEITIIDTYEETHSSDTADAPKDKLLSELNKKGFSSKSINIFAEKNSKINYYHFQKLGSNKIFYSNNMAITENHAEVNWNDFILGSKTTISNTSTILQGNYSKTKINNVFFANKKQQFDVFGQAIHRGKKTFSDLVAKGAVKDSSKGLYRGSIFIEDKAHKSIGNERVDIIMLDNDAEADAIPQLLIDNNDVKCSHAVAIGRVDAEKLFYLMSRGLSEEQSKNQIIKGFFDSTIKDIKLKQIVDFIHNEIDKKVAK